MNIAMFHWAFPPTTGGVETHLSILCPELVKNGYNISLLTGSNGASKTEYSYKGVKVKRSRLMDLNWLARRGFEGLRNKIDELFFSFIEENKPDIIHVHNMHYYSELHTYTLEKIAKEKNIPLILTAHNVWDSGLFLRLSLDVKWNKIIAVSDFIKRELDGIGVPSKKLTTVYHGIDIKNLKKKRGKRILKKFPELKDRRIILHPARTIIEKGCDVSIKALKLIKKKFPDILLILCGTRHVVDWESRQEKDIAYLLHLINRLGLEDNILMDSFSREQMINLYQLAEFSIYPSSFEEPFGLAIIESLSCAKPMIITDCGGMPEIIKNGENGFIIKRKDYSALAQKSLCLLKSEQLRQELGRNGKKLVEEKFTIEEMTKNVIDIYKEVKVV